MTTSVLEKPETKPAPKYTNYVTLSAQDQTWNWPINSSSYGTVTTWNYATVPVQRDPLTNLPPSLGSRIVKLLKAADEAITEKGWIQGSYYLVDKGFCLHGALQFAVSNQYPSTQWSYGNHFGVDSGAFNAAVQILTRIIQAQTFNCINDIPNWNDRPGRTAEDVHMLLKQGIEFAEANYR